MRNGVQAQNGTITLNISNENGNAFPGVNIRIENSTTGFLHEAVTDAGGRFSIDLPNGSYTVVASKDGYKSYYAFINVTGNTITRSAQLELFGWISVMITNQSGEAIIGAKITLTHAEGYPVAGGWVTEFTEGLASTRATTGTYKLTIEAEGYETIEVPMVSIVGGQTLEYGTVVLTSIN